MAKSDPRREAEVLDKKKRSGELERLLILPDTHAPFFCKKSWALMLRVAGNLLPHHLVHLGDLVDFYAISDFDKDPERLRVTSLKDEIDVTNKLLDQLDEIGAARKYFTEGNHEYRWIRKLYKKAPELVGLPGLSVPELFRFKQRGWSFTPYKDSVRIGKVEFTHECGGSGPSAHGQARDAYQSNAVIGHTHFMGTSYRGNARGQSQVGAAFGWLGDINAVDYAHRVKAKMWINGFGIGYLEPKSGNIHLQAIPIIKGRCVVDGKLYT